MIRKIIEPIEYGACWLAFKLVGLMPRKLARKCVSMGLSIGLFFGKNRPLKTAKENLQFAFQDFSAEKRNYIRRRSIQHLAWALTELAHFPRYNKQNIGQIVEVEGVENYTAAVARGKGVLLISGHFSSFELLPYALAIMLNSFGYLVRRIKNKKLDALLNQYRGLCGNFTIDKNGAARQVLSVLRGGGTVGITIDQNTSPHEGVFVNFFNKSACTTTGAARLALHTGATVIPAFILWDDTLQKYIARFEPAIELIQTGNKSSDIKENTQRFTHIIEQYVRRYPDQWTRWLHNRWRTRPPDEKIKL